MTDLTDLWTIIICLGVGSFGLRFAFLGLVGDKHLPDWFLRHLRYTAVSVIPALVAPLVLWPPATGGTPDATRIAAAFAMLAVSMITRNVFAAMGIGATVLIGLSYWF